MDKEMGEEVDKEVDEEVDNSLVQKKKIGFEVWFSDIFFGWAKLGFMNFFKFIDP